MLPYERAVSRHVHAPYMFISFESRELGNTHLTCIDLQCQRPCGLLKHGAGIGGGKDSQSLRTQILVSGEDELLVHVSFGVAQLKTACLLSNSYAPTLHSPGV